MLLATMMFTEPATPAGAMAVIWVDESTVKPMALFAPNFTEVTPVRLNPVITTLVPLWIGPLGGDMDVTVGATVAISVTVFPEWLTYALLPSGLKAIIIGEGLTAIGAPITVSVAESMT